MRDEVNICVEGLFLEKLIQRALGEGIVFQKIDRPAPRKLIITTDQSGSERLLRLCRRYAILAKPVGQRGKPRWLSLLRRRWTVLLGVFIGILVVCMVLSRLWIIDIHIIGDASGATDSENLRQALRNLNIRPGISNRLDTRLLSRQLEAGQSGYSFIDASIQGVRLLIEAAPETPLPETYDLESPRDICATISGIVTAIEVQSGQARVQVGDVIHPGQMLIEGQERISPEETRKICALGKVMVRTWFEGSATGNLHQRQCVPTGKTATDVSLHWMNIDFPLASGESFDQYESVSRHIPLVGLFIPLEVKRTTRQETLMKTVEINREALADRLCALSMADARLNLSLYGPGDYEIARSWIYFDTPDANTLTACAVYEIYTDAAATSGAPIQGG